MAGGVVKWNDRQILAAVEKAAIHATRKVATDIAREAKQLAPRGATGNLRRSITISDTAVSSDAVVTRVGLRGGDASAYRYALAVEYGRRPGKPPPSRELEIWVRRVVKPTAKVSARTRARLMSRASGVIQQGLATRRGLDRQLKANAQERLIKSVAFLIARSIGRKGTEEQRYMRPAFNNHRLRLEPEFTAKFQQLLNSVIPKAGI